MGKKKSSKDKQGRKNYVSEGRASRNKAKRIEKAALELEFYTLRNELMKKFKLTKGDAKRAARLVNQGVSEEEALTQVKSGVAPANKSE